MTKTHEPQSKKEKRALRRAVPTRKQVRKALRKLVKKLPSTAKNSTNYADLVYLTKSMLQSFVKLSAAAQVRRKKRTMPTDFGYVSHADLVYDDITQDQE